MATDKLEIGIKLVTEFHTTVKLRWKTENDYIINGKEWLDEIAVTYNDPDISKHMKDVLLNATYEFAKVANTQEPYYALIMKGGGIKGLAYIGALEELSKFYEFNWYAGTSAGAITATLLSANHTTEELKTILSEKNFKDFKDAYFIKAILNFFTKSGFYEANTFLEWLNNLLAIKLNSTTAVRLVDLPFRTTIYASNKSTSALIFDSTLEETKNVNAAFAARCSMSIPIIFTPQKSEGLNIFDGGLQNNFPVSLLLKDNPGTDFLGLYLGNETFKWKKNNIFKDTFQIWTESSDPEILRNYKEQIVVIDPSPISTLKFNLNKKEKDFLLEAGRLAALSFLDKKKLIDKSEFDFTQRKKNLDKQRSTLKKRKKILYFFRLVGFILFVTGLYFWKNVHEISKICIDLFLYLI